MAVTGGPLVAWSACCPHRARGRRSPGCPRHGRSGAAAALRGRLYVLGGEQSFGEALDTAEVLNLQTGTWHKAPSMLHARLGLAAVAAGGRLYAVGGSVAVFGLNIAERYSPLAGG